MNRGSNCTPEGGRIEISGLVYYKEGVRPCDGSLRETQRVYPVNEGSAMHRQKLNSMQKRAEFFKVDAGAGVRKTVLTAFYGRLQNAKVRFN